MRTSKPLLVLLLVAGCIGRITGPLGEPAGGDGGSTEEPCVELSADAGPDDHLTPTRLLRRTSLALRNTTPTDAEYDALLAAGDETAQNAWVDGFVDRTLGEPAFYRTMLELSLDWFSIPLIPPTADSPEYGARQQRVLTRCAATTAHPGALVYYRVTTSGEISPEAQCNQDVMLATIEPWWATGTTVTLVGYAANAPDPACKGEATAKCGCGPHGVSCWYDPGQYAGWSTFVPWNENGQRRNLAEEPARYFAHLAWFDLPMTDLLLSSKSVAPVDTQAAYVSQAIAGGRLELLDDDSWWRVSKLMGRVDPEHQSNDPNAWREYSVPARNPFLIEDRDYHYDPRVESQPMKGLPAAGILTSIGFLATFPRERVRASRALETFACEVLSPPSSQEFNLYVSDPATEGPCQHCHKRIDPAAIHFKRFAKHSDAFEGFGAKYFMPGIGGEWHWPKVWRTGAYPYGYPPFSHWNQWYKPGSQMTPVSEAVAMTNPESIFIDFLPTDQTLLGQTSDGTVGPLGFGKLIVASGAFDRCLVRHLHHQVLGRDIDPATEAGYLDVLTQRFVEGGRQVRPMIKSLTRSDLFRRGR